MITLSVLAIGIFSAFILYDLKRVRRRRRDQLHHRHAGVYLNLLQRVPEPAGAAGHLRRRAATESRQHRRSRQRGLRAPFSFSSAPAVEDRDALHVRRVREHVDHARGRAAIAGLVHQQAGVARQRRRVAADVDDAPRRLSSARSSAAACRSASALASANAPSRGGSTSQRRRVPIGQQLRPASSRTGCAPRNAARVARRGRSIASAFVARALHQRLAALDAQHLARPGRDRQREVAQAAEPVDHPLVALHVEQAQRARAPARG